MTDIKKSVRAIGLCSGGLDSILAGLVLKDQGIDVTWICFETPFFPADKARAASEMTGIPLIVKEITETYLEMLTDPPCGYGKHMNPCRDCHALMFRLAGEELEKGGYDFLFSGEVAGQRPLSQNKQALRYVEKRSGFDGKVLRPLSAKILPETEVEALGLVDRERLLGIQGRSRKEQMALAKAYGITEYPSPAGGCLLTDKKYSDRLRDLFASGKAYEPSDLHLLKQGRHLRLPSGEKVIIGRTKGDNRWILTFHDPARHLIIDLKGKGSPTVVVDVDASEETVQVGAALCAGYAKVPAGEVVEAVVRSGSKRRVISVAAVDPADFRECII
ncbi:tRNA 4-thiouridine(8) synthase ThiI [Desulfoluna spongiiphila]|uniref:tRNA 4-thiouridine(8) synthase ThiI n=1 Tax=Desulfoluna spongiiphila TaxID=419481 RepID=UPI001257369A|nr:tRNA 4-thiouridine(8) synthase ThiI [Desulfoluna spongiiphila]VVS93571.1 rossmann-like alpha/beta/alpha sandwich fold [Desulfoluna spongiiphila]